MDGTRVIRIIELYQNQYLVGKAFPPSPAGATITEGTSTSQSCQYEEALCGLISDTPYSDSHGQAINGKVILEDGKKITVP